LPAARRPAAVALPPAGHTVEECPMNDVLAPAFAALAAHAKAVARTHLRDLFAADPGRFAALSLESDGLLLDWSKNLLTRETMPLLFALARAADVAGWRERMFAGEAINATERRPVLHVALRNPSGRRFSVGGRDVTADVAAVLARMGSFAEAVRRGELCGATGKRFTDVVNLGIGGSDLGPKMVTLALAPYHDGPRVHYVSNVDGAHLHDTLRDLDPAATLFVIASKTFTTQETMTNAASARRWIGDTLGASAVGAHFAAVSTALDLVTAFGIAPERMFGFWEWVGGRYSVWSAVGLPVMIAIGKAGFDAFLAGGEAMDEHFRTTPLERNLPVIKGLIDVWYRDVIGFPTRAVIPYDQRLSRFPAHLQQLDMESNGKRVRRDGSPAPRPTGPIVWGEPGTNGQHAFFQLVHQGTDPIPIDFLVAAEPHESMGDHHAKLVANCLAQAEALMRGKTEAEVRAELAASGRSAEQIDSLAPHMTFPGNRPSTMLLYRRLDPFTMGRLLALYEHEVFVQGLIFEVNSFDQWGVELGKKLAGELLPMVQGSVPVSGRDSSTSGLLAAYHRLRQQG
jgi:glucose-6-phosphate isomerase